MKSQYKSCFLVIALLATMAFAQAEKRQQVNLHQQEIAEILAATDTYAYFGPAICSLASDLPALKKMAAAAGVDAQHLNALCEIAAQGYTTAPADMVKAALEEAAACVAACKSQLAAEELTRIADALEAYDQAVQSGAADVIVADESDSAEASTDKDEEEAQTRGTKKFDNVVIRKQASIGSLYVGGDTIINHNLTVNGDEIIHGNLTVYGNTVFTNTATQLIDGSLKVLENIKLPDALAGSAAQGILQLGVDPIYAFNMGTSNFFAGDYTGGMPATISTGSDNISIGTRANVGLTTQFQTIAIGSNANATGNASLALMRNSSATGGVGIAIGSSAVSMANSAIALGTLASATAINALAIGVGAQAFKQNAIALGTNASAPFDNSIAIGSAAMASGDNSVACGGVSTLASGISSIALGHYITASGEASIGIGGGSSLSTNSIAIGEGVTVLGDYSIALGTSATATGNRSCIAFGTATQALHPNSIAIGTSVVTTSTGTFIGNIFGAATATGALPVYCDSSNHLGTQQSSRRFKENFRNLDAHSAQLYNLNPVKFDYKASNGGAKDQFGLIAEEVAQHLPEIVVHDKDGQIYSVQYHVLPTLLLNEMKHHQSKFESQDEAIAQLRSEVAMLKAALQKSH